MSKMQDVLCSKVTVTISALQKPLLKATIHGYFTFRTDSIEQMRNEDGQLVFVPQILVQFTSLNYGSLRGVLFLKTQGTPLADYILPPMFFGQIIDKAFIVE